MKNEIEITCKCGFNSSITTEEYYFNNPNGVSSWIQELTEKCPKCEIEKYFENRFFDELYDIKKAFGLEVVKNVESKINVNCSAIVPLKDQQNETINFGNANFIGIYEGGVIKHSIRV